MIDRQGLEVTERDAATDPGPRRADREIRCDYPLCPNFGKIHTLADDSADRKRARS